MEHRDGSGISSLVRIPQPNSPTNGTKAGSNIPGVGKLSVPYFPFESVGQRSFAEDPNEKEAGLRKAQMAMRTAEIMECLHIMQEVDRGKGEEIASSSTRGLTSKLGEHISKGSKKQQRSRQEAQQLKLWKGKVDVEYPCLAGHSFGACTVIEMQRKPEGKQGEDEYKSPFPFSILLDPWVEPLEWRGEGQEPDARPMLAPAFAINSESFTIWRDQFSKLKRIMHDSREAVDGRHGWLMTLCGCQHLDFSDMGFLLPHIFRSTVSPKHTNAIFCRATYAQMGLMRQRWRDEQKLPGLKTDELIKEANGKIEESENSTENKDRAEGEKGQFGTGLDERGNAVRVKSEREQLNDEPEWTTSVEDSSRQLKGETQKVEGMSVLKKKKSRASDKVWQAKEARDKEANERRKRATLEERKRKGLVAVFANRSPSGNIALVKDAEECVDFSETGADVAADEDADKVHQGLEEISRGLEYKKPKVHSLMALLFRLNGLHPGLSNPGKVLIHQY
jgi:platelet-activating factor acetylhydrolase